MVDISVDSVLRCDPSLPNTLVCLLLGGSVMMVVMKLIGKSVVAVLSRSPEDVKDRVLSDIIDGLKSEEWADMTIKGFNRWAKGNPDKASGIKGDKTIEDFLSDGDFGSKDKAIDAYMESPSRKDVWREFAIFCKGGEMAIGLQHGVAGFFGLYAYLMAPDQDSFLTIARWGVLLEAGWELFDTAEMVLLLFAGKFGFQNLMNVFHHVALYLVYPLNSILLPSKIGRDVAMAIFLYSGLVSLQIPFQFAKNFVDIDLSEKKGRIAYMALSSVSIFTFFLPRGPHWCYFAYTLLSWALDEGVSKPLFALLVMCAIAFSLFNFPYCFFIYKGLVKAIKKVRAAAKEEEEDAKLRQTRRRRSSLADASRTRSGSTSGRRSRKSIRVLGMDLELDDDEDIGTGDQPALLSNPVNYGTIQE